MKRTLLVLCAVAALVGVAPAHAQRSYEGSVRTPIAHPAIPRTLYLETQKLNGAFGYVFPIEASQDERPFELRRLSGATGREDLDAWFYRDISGAGDPCPRSISSHTESVETGTVCPGATFAVVVLFAGADASFQLML
jgi:hypothetical protein